jgi:hypothetical protein
MKAIGENNFGRRSRRGYVAIVALLVVTFAVPCLADDATAARHFHERVEPILERYCYGCHGYGASEGGHAFDEFKSDKDLVGNIKLWQLVIKNVRSHIMPPPEELQPTNDERHALFDWIELDAFKINPADPDPGRVTLRRLNRVEYRNTVRDLTGVDFDTSSEFPPDDSGYGFDNIGDAMSMSPLLMEKYLNAARAIVKKAVPDSPPDKKQKKDLAKYRRIFTKGAASAEAAERQAYAREILNSFVRRAYRRPADDRTVERLVEIAKSVYTLPDQSFETGISSAMVAVLASPRFLFRAEGTANSDDRYPLVDEFTLASRLSYFLWSTMPDDELLQLAERGELRANLQAQVDRMLKDDRSAALAENFAGQWLRARDITHIDIDPLGALGRQDELLALQARFIRAREERERRKNTGERDDGTKDDPDGEQRWQEREKLRAEFRRLRAIGEMFNDKLRQAMRDETHECFNYVLHEDRNVMELVDCNYTFLNETLAKHYGIDGVKGDEMRRVDLPEGSVRGGLLTQGTILAVTSNPNRTSPVKRGLFILDNILGAPAPPPPPPNISTLESAETGITGRPPTVRELMVKHREEPLCASCHARMDPLGLALENFNAMGMWRDKEHEQAIDASGTLQTGEKIDGIRELKAVLKTRHRVDFYRCLTEKLLTYALGRGLEYYDERTVDSIVERLDREQGRFSAVLTGIIDSPPFQRQRRADVVGAVELSPNSTTD